MSLILNLETGTDICSVALAADGKLLSLRESDQGRHHAQNLGVYIDEILRENNVDPEDLDAVAVGMGPGSYTGLRIGVSLSKGLCYALGKPLIAVNSLQALATVAREDYRAGLFDLTCEASACFCPMIDARRMEVYVQVFDSKIQPLAPVLAHVVTPESFREFIEQGEFVIFGNGAEKCVETLLHPNLHYVEVIPSARGMVEAAEAAFQAVDFVDLAYFEPLYLKDFVVTPSKKKIF